MTTDTEFRCNCVGMTRAIKDKIDAELADMTGSEIINYLQNAHTEFSEYISSVRAIKSKIK